MPTTKAGKKRMTQTDVINHFADKFGFKRAEMKEIFDELANLAQSEVKANNEFVLPGLGKLVLSQRKAREGRNPATGVSIQIPAKTTLKFRVGKSLKASAGLGGDPTTGDDPGFGTAGDPTTGDKP